MQQIEKITILDFDGTILDSSRAWFDVYQSYCKNNNLTISEQINQNQYNFSYSICFEAIKSTHNTTQLSKSQITSLNEIAKEVYNKISPKAGFAEFVKIKQALKSKIIIISREEPDLIKSYLKQRQIFEISEVFQDCNKNRTRADFFTDFSKMYSCKMQNITFLDDSLFHCSTAKQAGAFVVGINDNHSVDRQKQMKLVCDAYVNDFTPILKYE